jgi:hypothetical protein
LLAGLALAYGALTRETVMVAVGAIAIAAIIGLIRARRSPGRDDLARVQYDLWVFELAALVFVAIAAMRASRAPPTRN